MRRSQCLNGEWNFMPLYEYREFGDTLEGICWKPEKVRVPSSWRYGFDIKLPDGENFSPYNVFDVPGRWNDAYAGILGRKIRVTRKPGERVWLVFKGVLQSWAVYVNDHLVHRSQDAFLPQRIDITDILSDGTSEIDIKVWCGSFNSLETDNGNKHLAPDGTWFANIARGIWQDVFLEYTAGVYINDIQVITSFRSNSIGIRTEIKAEKGYQEKESEKISLKLRILEQGKQVKCMSAAITGLQDGNAEAIVAEPWEDPRVWSPEDPYLYTLQLELKRGETVIDSMEIRFGFREVWNEQHKIYLNGVRINLRGDAWHYQGFAMQTKAYALNWFKMCKEAGINFVRPHGMPYPEFFLEAADETGMLIIDESAIYGSGKSIQADHPEYIENCRKHLEALVRRDRNHPSVIMWSMQNEMRWVDGRDIYRENIGSLMFAIEQLDGTRRISCDGDNRLVKMEDMQVLSMHYNIDGTVKDWDKSLPLIFGEHGKWHYVSPQVSSGMGGPSAYVSFEKAMGSLGEEEQLFLEYARKHEVTGISPFNTVNYMMKALPEEDITLEWDDLTTPGVKPKVIRNHSITLDNGLLKKETAYCPNSSYSGITEGFRPVTILRDEYNSSFFGGTKVSRSFSIYNDTLRSVNSLVEYEVTCEDGSVIAKGKESFLHTAGERHPLTLTFTIPDADGKQTLQLSMRLLQEGIEKYYLEHSYKVYPRTLKKQMFSACRQIAYIGCRESCEMLAGAEDRLRVIEEISFQSLEGCKLLIIGKNFKGEAESVQPVLNAFTQKGGVVLILEQDTFAAGEVNLSRRRYFKSFINIKDHPVFLGLDNEDMSFWDAPNPHESKCRYMVENAFNKPVHGDVSVLLECGEGDFGWGGLLWSPLLEYRNGKGLVIMSQLELTEHFNAVPQACVLLRNLVEYAMAYSAPWKADETVIITESKEFKDIFLNDIGLECTCHTDIEMIPEDGCAILDPALLEPISVQMVRKKLEAGATVLVPAVSPEKEGALRELVSGAASITEAPVYQLAGTEHELVNGISIYDLYRYESVTYSPSTKKNIALCEHSVQIPGAESLLENVKNPWHLYFIEHLDAEPIKIGIATKYEKSVFANQCYGALLPVGSGKLVIIQVKPVREEKTIRVYTRLLANLHMPIQTNVLNYVKDDHDYSVDSFMGLKYDGKQDCDNMLRYFSDSSFALNNLGEGVYGWMTRYEKQDGFITLPGSAGHKYFLTVYIESAINRNPLKREAGQLPDSSIVPDLLLQANCSFQLWIKGIFYKEYTNTSGFMATVKIDDVLLEKGLSNLLLVAEGREDIRLNACFVNKYGDPIGDLKYILTLD